MCSWQKLKSWSIDHENEVMVWWHVYSNCVDQNVFSGYSSFIYQLNWPTQYNWNIVVKSRCFLHTSLVFESIWNTTMLLKLKRLTRPNPVLWETKIACRTGQIYVPLPIHSLHIIDTLQNLQTRNGLLGVVIGCPLHNNFS